MIMYVVWAIKIIKMYDNSKRFGVCSPLPGVIDIVRMIVVSYNVFETYITPVRIILISYPQQLNNRYNTCKIGGVYLT